MKLTDLTGHVKLKVMEQFSSDEARRNFRRILNEVEHGETVEILRYGEVAAVMVPSGWYEKAKAALHCLQQAGFPANDPRSLGCGFAGPKENDR